MNSLRLNALAQLVLFACLWLGLAPSTAHSANLTGSLSATTEVSSLGGSTFQLPIQVPPGILGMQPALSVQYNNQQGDGLIGLGMSLTGLSSISRCGATLPLDGYISSVDFTLKDRFCLDGTRLIVIKGNYGQDGSEYHTESETWTRIIAKGTCGNGPCSFTATNKDGWTLEFATTPDSRPLVTGGPTAISWQIARTSDLNGNAVRVEYAFTADGLQSLPQRVAYTENTAGGITQGSSEVRFDYQARTDALPRYMGGQKFLMNKRLSAIHTRTDSADVLNYNFTYSISNTTSRSLLSSVNVCSARTGECLSPTNFTWQQAVSDIQSPNNNASGVVASGFCKGNGSIVANADFNSDGRPDLLCTQGSTAFVLVSTGTIAQSPNTQATGKLNLPTNWCTGSQVMLGWTDFNGDRKTDLVCSTGASTFKAMLSTGTDVKSANNQADGKLNVPTQWCDASAQCQVRLTNFDGDARGDLACDCANGDHRVLISSGSDVRSPNSNATGTVVTGFCAATGATTSWGDFNGDGQSDLFCHDHGTQSVLVSTGKQLVSPNQDARGLLRSNWCTGASDMVGATDFNGDGLADLSCRVSSGVIEVLLSTGKSVISPNNDANGVVKSGWCSASSSTLDWGDFNGDGLADAFCHETSGRQSLLVSTGTLLKSPNNATDGLLKTGWCQNSAFSAGNSDFNGDALTDLSCADSATGTQSVLVHKSGFPDLLTSATNGLGGGARFSYQPMTNNAIYLNGDPVTYPVLDVRTPLYLVDNYTQFDGKGANYAFTYLYQGARTQIDLRRWLGFQQIKRTTVADKSYSLTHYTQNYPIVGFIDQVSQFASNGGLMTKSTFTPTVIKPYTNVAVVLPLSEQSSTYTAGSADYVYEKKYEYDTYGNASLIQDLGQTNDPSDDVYDCWVYLNDTTQWRLGYIQSHRTTRTASSCRTFLQTPSTAWNNTTDLIWDRTGYDTNLNPAALDAWDNQNSVWLTQSETYDGFGNVTSMTDWAGNTTRLTLDTSKRFVIQVTSPVLSSGLQLTTQMSYDAGFGNLLIEIDANGNQNKNEYDGFGRQIKTYGPLPSSNSGLASELLSTIQYSQDSSGSYVETRERHDWSGADPTTWPYSRLYVDGLGRSIRAIQSGPVGGQEVVAEQTYNNLGLLSQNSYPHFVDAAASWMSYEYDSFSRPIKLTQPDGVIQNIEYIKGELQVLSTLARGTADERSNTVYRSVREAVTKTVGRNGGTTTKQYDPLVQTSQSIGPNGNVTTFNYDSLRRVIGSTSADSGEKHFIYNAQGLLTTIQSPDNKSIAYTYDALGRVLLQSTSVNGQVYAYSYTYDSTTAQNGLGQLTQVVMPTATQNFAYTPYGEVQQESLLIDGHTYTESYDYAPTGLLTQLIYPDNAVLNTGYDAVGNLTTQDFKDSAQASSRQIANYSKYSAQNQVINAAFGNGTNTAFDYYSYAESMARPKSMSLTASGTARYNASYSWNKVGQFATSNAVHGSSPAESNTYTYDSMGWLKQATGPYGTLDYAYDSAGNITLKDGITYTYAPNTNHLAGASNGLVAGHDGAGNVSNLNWTNANWNYNYNTGGNLDNVKLNGTSQTSYLYDFAGNRLKRTDASGAISLYVSADFDVTISNGQTLYTRYINGPDGRIAASTVNAPTDQATADLVGLGINIQGLSQHLWHPRVEATIGNIDSLLSELSLAHLFWMILLLTLIVSLWLGHKAKLSNEASGGNCAPWRSATVPWIMATFLTATWPVQTAANLSAGDGLPVVGDLYFNTDTLGSSVLVTDDEGKESSVVAYLPYGDIDQNRSSGPNDFRPKFTGAELDQTVGLNYLGARYQHPTLGRFLQPDPQNQFASPYAYVGNDPLTLTDPNGEFVQLLILAAVVVAGAYTGGSAVNHEMDPSHWDWRKGNTYAGIFAGATIGAAGGAIGAAAFEVGVATGIAGSIAVGAGESAAYSALGGGSPKDIAEASLMGGAFGGLTAGVAAGAGALAGSASRMMARGGESLAEGAGAVKNRSLSIAASESENDPLLSASDARNCFSFAAGTQIATQSGTQDIEKIRTGDSVWARSENGTVSTYPVLALHQREAHDIIEVQIEGMTLVTTREHPFWTQSDSWVKAYLLKQGDLLRDKNGQVHPVSKVTANDTPTRVYNFEVAEAHTYFAGDSDKQVLVHNTTCTSKLGKGKGTATSEKTRKFANNPSTYIPKTVTLKIKYKSDNGTDKTRFIKVKNPKVKGQKWDAGHIVGMQNGGSGTDIKNIFPQNITVNRWKKPGYVEAQTKNVKNSKNAYRSWRDFEDKINRKVKKYGPGAITQITFFN